MSHPFSLRQASAIAFPVRRDPAETPRVIVGRWALHLTAWALVALALWQFNRWAEVDRLIRAPWPNAHQAWLPLLFASVYGLAWLSRGLWLALRDVPAEGVWLEVDTAWHELRDTLEKTKIDFQLTPIFLILGPLEGDVRAWLDTVGAQPQTRRTLAPFQTFAHGEAVFLICDPISRLARPALEECDGRLGHLCERLANQRTVRLPIQGVLLALPAAALQSDVQAQALAQRMQDDLRVLRQATGIETPIHLAICGLGPVPTRESRAWRLSFPPLPDLDLAEVPSMLADGVDWLCLERMPADLRPAFRLGDDAVPSNVEIFQATAAVQKWRTRLLIWLTDGTQTDDSEPAILTGCSFLSASPAGALLSDLLMHQHSAALTAAASAAREAQRRQQWVGYTLGVLGVSTCVAILVLSFVFRA